VKKEFRITKIQDTGEVVTQITIADERWYMRPTADGTTGLPSYDAVPSVTWITSHYPKGIGFYKWLANTGWDEAEAIKQAAGDKGSKVHQAAGDLVDGQTIGMEAPYLNRTTGLLEPLSLEEYECLIAFRDWWADAKPTLIAREFVVWGDGYAGTGDLLCLIDKKPWLLDLKTGQYVWPEHELQVSAYAHALPAAWADPPPQLGILQVGYKKNKRGWKLTEVDDQYDLFLSAKAIWKKETEGQSVFKRDYPLAVSLNGAGVRSVAEEVAR